MNISQITPSVFYVGVNDRVTDRFEALWPLPYGVSYNSYVVKGEKTALIDCVEVSEVINFLNNIENTVGSSTLDYLVINHMEPDHSGAIPLVVEKFPQIKIIGNRQTIAMVKGFYHLDRPDLFLEVKDGDSVDLGGRTLRFRLTPMVHWPETMVTYLEEEAVLFSGDAFGSFGALNGGVIDTEMETGMYMEEMYRYYSNIVGKYGRSVLAALAKLDGLRLDYVCSTHGPVWHDRIADVAALVKRLASYEPEEGVVIVYGSMYGNTAETAEAIARALAARGMRRIILHNASHSNMSYMISDAFRYKGLIVGGPTYSMTLFPPVAQFMQAMETREIKNKVFGTFGSFTWASVVPAKLAEYAQRMKLDVVASLEFKQSPSAQTAADVEAFADAFMAAMKGRHRHYGFNTSK